LVYVLDGAQVDLSSDCVKDKLAFIVKLSSIGVRAAFELTNYW
jgi:hypothetical protein